MKFRLLADALGKEWKENSRVRLGVAFILLLLIVFGFLNGMQILKRDLPKPMAMFVHIGIFCTSAFMIYMASAKPF